MANALAPQPRNSFLDSLYSAIAAATKRGKRIAEEDLPAYAAAVQQRLLETAENLPTTEENLNTLRRGASGLYDRLSEGAGAVVGGLNRMADMASNEGDAVRAQIMQRYNLLTAPTVPQAVNPMGGYRGPYDAFAPEVALYMAPDGSGEMWPREKIEAYYDALQNAFRQNVIEDVRPAPSRAAFRQRQQRMSDRNR